MSIATFQAVVEQGQIRLRDNVRLPEQATVYVIVPTFQVEQAVNILSPRLVHPEEAADFVLEVMEEPCDAGV
jgi:hypothetical protein